MACVRMSFFFKAEESSIAHTPHSSIDGGWVTPTRRLLWITPLWTWVYKYLSPFSIIWGIYPQKELLDRMVIPSLIFWGNGAPGCLGQLSTWLWDLGAGRDLRVLGRSPSVGVCAQQGEASLSLSSCPFSHPQAHACTCSLFLSQINKIFKVLSNCYTASTVVVLFYFPQTVHKGSVSPCHSCLAVFCFYNTHSNGCGFDFISFPN